MYRQVKTRTAASVGACTIEILFSVIILFPEQRLFYGLPRARDLVTIAEVGSTRLISLERITTGVGSVSRSAWAKHNSLGSSLRPTLLHGADSMVSIEPVNY